MIDEDYIDISKIPKCEHHPVGSRWGSSNALKGGFYEEITVLEIPNDQSVLQKYPIEFMKDPHYIMYHTADSDEPRIFISDIFASSKINDFVSMKNRSSLEYLG